MPSALFSEQGVKDSKHIFYYHGKIIEDQGLPAKSDKFGTYDYKHIIQALDAAGFTVHSEIRAAGTDVAGYAAKEIATIQSLIASGVAPQNITLIGGSKGAVIAMTIQNTLQNPSVRSVLLAGMFPSIVGSDTMQLYGHVLSIFATNDTLVVDPQPLVTRSKELQEFKSIEVSSPYGHGLLFKPYAEWVEPAILWARGTSDTLTTAASDLEN